MPILIDSNVLIKYLKGEEVTVQKIQEYIHDATPLFISTISLYEVYLGIIANKYLKEGRPHKIPDLLSDYEKFVNFCFVLNFTREAGKKRQIFMLKRKVKE